MISNVKSVLVQRKSKSLVFSSLVVFVMFIAVRLHIKCSNIQATGTLSTGALKNHGAHPSTSKYNSSDQNGRKVKPIDCKDLRHGLVGELKMAKHNATNHTLHTEPAPEALPTYTTDKRGRWFPLSCQPKQKTVIVIPFRDRYEHLKIFIEHFVPILQRQLLDYIIVVVEQDFTQNFNRGFLFNVGYKEALLLTKDNPAPLCMIQHDVDLLLENDRMIYECSKNPTHFSVSLDKFKYRLLYSSSFGGVTAVLGEQFERSNGYSNVFFFWGGEDDDFRNRLHVTGYRTIQYKNASIARYSMLKHQSAEVIKARLDALIFGNKIYHCDGLNSLDYTVKSRTFEKHYVLIKINVPSVLKTSSICRNCISKHLKTNDTYLPKVCR
ncbi:unnamed protein product [Owenia fusiformis]|uniref:Beta-1,4-galactosyltransferase n=1 Tax=Owenia fusiformis TaxID=6347 RepID=A0A8J1UHI8_OWEFU|nr:unnamed protein product [Owenia fusiformis]